MLERPDDHRSGLHRQSALNIALLLASLGSEFPRMIADRFRGGGT